MAVSQERLASVLRARFGHASFRPGQEDCIRHVLEGRHVLAVMPTGAGKSLCFQLPALLLEGITLVISPLIALMKDQVDRLCARGIEAGCLNSAQSEAERAGTERQLSAGTLRLLFVAPERLRHPRFLEAMGRVSLALAAVDEAHCVVDWGHGFRPDYERLGESLERLAPSRLLALTATASPDLRGEIARALRMRSPAVIVAGFDRPNIHLEVHRLRTEAEKRDTVLAAVQAHRPAIVYAATRNQAERVARHLRHAGEVARAYHGGMEGPERDEVQDHFNAQRLPVVVATAAFGLGVDKADVRLVLHADLPRSLEAYYQEFGRAGRDGSPALAALLFAPRDVVVQRLLLDLGNPTPSHVLAVLRRLARFARPAAQEELLEPGPRRARLAALAALRFLVGAGLVDQVPAPGPLRLRLAGRLPLEHDSDTATLSRLLGGDRGTVEEAAAARALGAETPEELRARLEALARRGALRVLASPPRRLYVLTRAGGLTETELQRLRRRALRDRARLEQMVRLAGGAECRRATLLAALGERSVRSPCGACDVCAGHRLVARRSRLETGAGELFDGLPGEA